MNISVRRKPFVQEMSEPSVIKPLQLGHICLLLSLGSWFQVFYPGFQLLNLVSQILELESQITVPVFWV